MIEFGFTSGLTSDDMLPYQWAALRRAWGRKQRRESQRFAALMTAWTGGSPNDYLPPDEDDEPANPADEQKKREAAERAMVAAINQGFQRHG